MIDTDKFYAAHSFIELIKYLFTFPGVKVFRLCQDPLEFFWLPMTEGWCTQQPQCICVCRNIQALRVVNNLCSNVKKGICHGNKMDESTDITDKQNMSLKEKKN